MVSSDAKILRKRKRKKGEVLDGKSRPGGKPSTSSGEGALHVRSAMGRRQEFRPHMTYHE